MTNEAREKLVEWLFSQGVSTVLLCGILGFMAFDKVKLEPKRAEDLAKANAALAAQHIEAVKQVIASHERERDVFITLLEIRGTKPTNFKAASTP